MQVISGNSVNNLSNIAEFAIQDSENSTEPIIAQMITFHDGVGFSFEVGANTTMLWQYTGGGNPVRLKQEWNAYKTSTNCGVNMKLRPTHNNGETLNNSGILGESNDFIVCISATTIGTTLVHLPWGPVRGDMYVIKDSNGIALTRPIIVSANTGTMIEGESFYRIGENYGAATFVYNGTGWNILNRVPAKCKTYTALLTQSATDAPTATVLENTLGDIVWTRDGVGTYLGTLASAFTADKTTIVVQASKPGYQSSVAYAIDVNTISLLTYASNVLDDDGLLKTPVEIRVYS